LQIYIFGVEHRIHVIMSGGMMRHLLDNSRRVLVTVRVQYGLKVMNFV